MGNLISSWAICSKTIKPRSNFCRGIFIWEIVVLLFSVHHLVMYNKCPSDMYIFFPDLSLPLNGRTSHWSFSLLERRNPHGAGIIWLNSVSCLSKMANLKDTVILFWIYLFFFSICECYLVFFLTQECGFK